MKKMPTKNDTTKKGTIVTLPIEVANKLRLVKPGITELKAKSASDENESVVRGLRAMRDYPPTHVLKLCEIKEGLEAGFKGLKSLSVK